MRKYFTAWETWKYHIKKRDHAQATDFYFEIDTSIKRLSVWHVLSSYRV